MRICVIHGYSLAGTGSNIFVKNLVESLKRRGHRVLLFCQDRHPQNYGFIDSYYEFDRGNRGFSTVYERRPTGAGEVLCFRPNTAALLPVYVHDDYEGFTVKEFQSMEQSEIEDYVAAVATAVKTVRDDIGFDAVQCNHIIASPAAARLATEGTAIPYVISLQGSALNFSVKVDPERLARWALLGLEGAAAVTALSSYTADQLNDWLASIGRAPIDVDVIYPGADLNQFVPASDRQGALDAGVAAYKQVSADDHVRSELAKIEKLDLRTEKLITFAGKLMPNKGIHALILALVEVLAHDPETSVLIAGFGEYRPQLEALAGALGKRDGAAVRQLVYDLENVNGCVPVGSAFIERLSADDLYNDYLNAAAKLAVDQRVIFAGNLNHEELSHFLGASKIFCAPSVYPESLGLVAVEALAAGAYPVITDAFGLAEVNEKMRTHWPDLVQEIGLLSVDAGFVENLATICKRALDSELIGSPQFKAAAHRLVADYFNWDEVAKEYEILLAPEPEAIRRPA